MRELSHSISMPTVSLFVAAVLSCTVADAQETTSQSLEVAEVTVTAQRREENLQKVPISISTFGAENLVDAGATKTQDLQALVPGLSIAVSNSGLAATLRGIGSDTFGPQIENSPAFYVDGVYIGSHIGSLFNLDNVERVEVLKGPQGTLFGRNTTSGVIQLITRKPSAETGGKLSLEYGSYDTKTLSGYFMTGLTESLAADIAVYYTDQGKGWGRNILTGQDAFRDESLAIRSKWVLDLPNTDVTFAFDHTDTDSDIAATYIKYPGTQLLAGGVPAAGGFYDTVQSSVPVHSAKNTGGSLTIDHTTGFANIASITAYRDAKSDANLDQDFTAAMTSHVGTVGEFEQFTQELQILSPDDSKFKWIGGLFYMDRKAGYSPVTINNLFSVEGLLTTKSSAAFAQMTYPVSANTQLTAGARYTEDDLKWRARRDSTNPALVVPTQGSGDTQDKVTWRLALDHQFTDNFLAYVSYNTGYRSGGTPVSTAPSPPPFKPETVDAYELGMKSELFERRLRLNASVFHYNYDDMQVLIVQTGTTRTLNAGTAEISGLDIDTTLAATESLTLQAGLVWLWDANYTKFTNASFFVPLPNGGNLQTTGDLDGNRLSKAPDVSANFIANYSVPMPYGKLGFNLTVKYSGEIFFEPSNTWKQEALTLVNTSLKWISPSESWSGSLWVRNLTDEEYINYAFPIAAASLATPGAPRTYGVSASYSF